MAPGAFSLFAPFLRRRTKKYEKLETEDPERRRQEAAVEELVRINHKIDKLVSSITKEDFEPPTSAEDECLGCGECRAVMQVSPCGHQALCRLCFIKNIQQAVSSRSLPLCCVMCHTKIQRVKNNHRANHAIRGGQGRPRSFPSSVSGYQLPTLSKSQSHYSVHSASSCGSARSVRSSASLRSISSIKSSASSSSWFSINSLSSFQCDSDKTQALSKPRPHSLTNSRHRLGLGMRGPSRSSIPQSFSSPAIRSMAARPEPPVQAPVASFSAHNLSAHCLQPERMAPLTPSPTSPNPPRGSSSPATAFAANSNQNCAAAAAAANNPGPDSSSASMRIPPAPPASRPPSFSRRRVKSPEVAETTFTMSTIEEEMEGVSIKQENEP